MSARTEDALVAVASALGVAAAAATGAALRWRTLARSRSRADLDAEVADSLRYLTLDVEPGVLTVLLFVDRALEPPVASHPFYWHVAGTCPTCDTDSGQVEQTDAEDADEHPPVLRVPGVNTVHEAYGWATTRKVAYAAARDAADRLAGLVNTP